MASIPNPAPFRAYFKWFWLCCGGFFLMAAAILPLTAPLPTGAGLTQALTARRPRVVLLGDSVIRTYRSNYCDSGQWGIDDWLRHFLGDAAVLSAAGEFHSPLLFADLADLIITAPHRPETVIVPLNPRAFSAEWRARPAYGFRYARAMIHLRAGPWRWRDHVDAFLYGFTPLIDLEMALWRRQRIVYPDFDLGERRVLHEAGSRIPEALECHPELKVQYADALRGKFIYHYLYRLSADNPQLSALDRLLGKLSQARIKALVYLTPINVEDGLRFVGLRFGEIVDHNRRGVAAFLETRGVPYLDLADALGAERFIDQHAVCEHLDDAGRRFVGRRLAEALMGSTAGPPS